jgi:hypothetical protein
MFRTSHPVVLLLLGTLVACGEPPSEPMPDPGDEGILQYTEIACPALSLAAASGLPMDQIATGELPGALTSPTGAAITVVDQAIEGFAYVVPDSTGDLQLVVPLHPATPASGGAVRLTFTDGTRACAPVDFTIQPMPAADGELAAVVDLVQAILTDQAAIMGTTPTELVSTLLLDLPPGLWPLAVTQTAIADPANDSSLRAFVENALDAEGLDLANRLLGLTDLRTSLEAAQSAPLAAATALQEVAVEECTVSAVGSSASQLNLCMNAAAEANRRANGISKRVADDIVKMIGVINKLPFSEALPFTALIEQSFGVLFWTVYNQRLQMAAIFPSQFTAMSLAVDRSRFLEDEEAQGRVTDAQVQATSVGWDPQKAIVEAVKQMTSLISFGLGSDSLVPYGDKIAEQIGGMIARRLADGNDLNTLVVPPQGFGPVDVTDPAWLRARVAVGDAIAVVSGTTYEPRREGTATLSVRTLDGEGNFGGQQIAAQEEITVGLITLSISPADTVLPPGGTATFTVTVQDAMFPAYVGLDDPGGLQGTATIAYQGGDSHQVSYTAPAQPDFDTPDFLTVWDTASTGARAGEDVPDRNATAVIRFASVAIAPFQDCLALDSTHQFEFTVVGLTDQTLEWDASVGEIDDDGFYQAPSTRPEDGVAIIVARSAEYPEVVDSTTISIGCACAFAISVGGAAAMDPPGHRLVFSALTGGVGPEEDAILLILLQETPPEDNNIEDTKIRVAMPLGATGPGTYTPELGGSFPLVPPDNSYYNIRNGDVSLDILEYVPEQLLRGVAYGSVAVVTQVGPGEFDERVEQFFMSFEIRVPDGWDPPPTAFGSLYACEIGGGGS